MTVNPTRLPAPTGGTAYSQTLAAGGGIAPYTYTVTDGILPYGLTLSPNGVISGSPTMMARFDFTVTATDAYGLAGLRPYSVTVADPVIRPTPCRRQPPDRRRRHAVFAVIHRLRRLGQLRLP